MIMSESSTDFDDGEAYDRFYGALESRRWC
jgi:hypothetical protein